LIRSASASAHYSAPLDLCLYSAWNCPNATPFRRITAAARRLKIVVTLNKVNAGISLGTAVISLLPTVNTRLLDPNDQQYVMSTFAGVASDLFGLFLASNRPTEGLESPPGW
jgi:hypothetical protein